MVFNMFNIPAEGWIALGFWGFIIVIPWVYSVFLIRNIEKSGVERWGASKPKTKSNNTPVESEVNV